MLSLFYVFISFSHKCFQRYFEIQFMYLRRQTLYTSNRSPTYFTSLSLLIRQPLTKLANLKYSNLAY